MQDSEREIPSHRSASKRDSEDEYYSEIAPDYREETSETRSNQGRVVAIIVGILAGIINVVFPLIVTIANAATYRAIARLQDKATLTQAWTVTGLCGLNFAVNALVCVLAGYVTGKITRNRQVALYAGAISGAMTYLVAALLDYIPNFPGQVASGTPTTAATSAGTIAMIVLTLVYAVVGMLLAFLGSHLATNRYYIAKRHL